MEALAQSEGQLREQVSALEEEKRQLASTVTRLQDLLKGLGIHTSPEGHGLPPPSERHAANRTVDSLPHPLALPEGS